MSLELVPFFMLNGNAKEAIAYYEQTLDAKLIFIQTQGDQVAHSVLQIGLSKIMLSDKIKQVPFQHGTEVNICITTDEQKNAEKIYAALSEEGEILLPLGKMPFSPAYGIVKDKFDICFQIFTQAKKQI